MRSGSSAIAELAGISSGAVYQVLAELGQYRPYDPHERRNNHDNPCRRGRSARGLRVSWVPEVDSIYTLVLLLGDDELDVENDSLEP